MGSMRSFIIRSLRGTSRRNNDAVWMRLRSVCGELAEEIMMLLGCDFARFAEGLEKKINIAVWTRLSFRL